MRRIFARKFEGGGEMKRKGLLKKGLAVTLALTMVVPGGLSVSAEEVGQTETQETEPGVTEEDQIPEEGKNPEDVQETKEQEGVPSEEEKESSEKKEDVTEETSRDVQDLAESEEKEAAEGDEITAEDVVTMTKPDGTAVHYKSIQEAVTAVPDYDYKENKGMYTIQLQKDVSEDVKIPENKYIVMDLAGHKLTNVAGHTVTNCSMRTKISDTVGGGIVDNLTHGKGAVYNDVNASITLNGGMFTRSAEASTDGSSAGGNSWYVLKNYGEMTINKGVSVKFSDGNPGYFSSLIGNGWQNGAQAESGNNGEPKPSASKKKASLRIAGGTFTGGKIVVKNDDYGTLKISAGTFSQPTAGYYNILNNNTAEISGGSFEAEGTAVGSIHYDGGANNGDITVTGGTFTSAEEEALQLLGGAKGTVNGGTFTSIGSSAVSVEGGSSVTVTGGSFSARDKETAVIFMDDHASSKAQISGGSFKNTTQEHVANKENSFAEGYGPVDPDRDGTFEMGVVDAGAIVTEKDGTVTSYATLREAAKAAPEGSTVQLQRDAVLGQWGIETSQFGVTLDLNGHKIDGSAVTGNRGRAVYLHTSYGTTPSEGIDRIVRVINSSDQEAKISARIPVESSCGNSEYSLPVEIAENVSLEVLEGGTDAVKLGSSTYLIYTEKSAEYIKNGGFKAEAEGEVRIYGTYSSAASAAAGKTVEMLHDYTGSDTISSGSAGGVLDLGGHTYISQNPNEIVDLNYDNVDLTIKNGTLKSGQASLKQAGITMLYNKGSLTLDKVNLIVPGSSYGIVTNGTNKENKITLKDSVLDVSDGFGIYFPSSGSVKIENSVIKAKQCGVQICSGSLSVSGKDTEITVTGNPEPKTESDGAIIDGAAVSIIEREGYQDLGTINIKEGTFSSVSSSSPVKAYKFNNTDKTEQEWDEAGKYIEISGGTFSSKVPGDLCAENYNPVEVKDADGNITYGVADEVKIDFLGGSLRMDYKKVDGSYDFTKTSLRFGYQIQLPEGAVLESWKWDYGTSEENLFLTVKGEYKVPQADGSFVSNLVLTDAPVAKYDTLVYTALSVTYEKDGKTITVTDKTESRSVKAVAEAIVNAPNAPASEREYAEGLLNAFNKKGWTGYY